MATKKQLVVLAIGGNALILDNQHQRVEDQYAALVECCRHIVRLLEQGYRLVLTHGNGPQVGFILRRSELSRHELHPVPLDSCGADTQGAIGYQIQQAMYNRMRDWPKRLTVATVITQTLVDAADPASSSSALATAGLFRHPLRHLRQRVGPCRKGAMPETRPERGDNPLPVLEM